MSTAGSALERMLSIVIVPTYNEAENITPLISQVLQQRGIGKLIIVDDASPDGTGQMADELARRQPDCILVIHRAAKLGLGTAYVAGFQLALTCGADRIITMDADFSHHPDYIPHLLDKSMDHELVIGSRYVPGGGVRRWGLNRQVLSRSANFVAHTLLGLRARDCTAGFRCYHADLLRSVGFEQIQSNGYSFLIEMLFLCQYLGARVGEVPIIFEDRRAGQSKISKAEILRAWQTVLRLVSHRFPSRFRWMLA